jgi:hypothetical protein
MREALRAREQAEITLARNGRNSTAGIRIRVQISIKIASLALVANCWLSFAVQLFRLSSLRQYWPH